MASLSVISWRDIPSQVVVKRGRETSKIMLSARFQEAIDRAAMRAGKTGSDAYIADWARSEPRACHDDVQAEAQAEAARLEALYDEADLLRLIRAHGVDDSKSGGTMVGDVTAGDASTDGTVNNAPGAG